MTKSNTFKWSNINAFYISLPYLFNLESTIQILVFRNIHGLERSGFLGQLSLCKMPNLDAVYNQRIGKGCFSDILDQCSNKVVTAKFDMSDDLERSILKAKM